MRARHLIQRRPAIIFRQGGVGVMRLFFVGVFDPLVEFSLEAPPLRLLRADTMQEDGSVERTSVCVCPETATFGRWRRPFRALRQSVATCGRRIEPVVGV
jgi:hypothetical protein